MKGTSVHIKKMWINSSPVFITWFAILLYGFFQFRGAEFLEQVHPRPHPQMTAKESTKYWERMTNVRGRLDRVLSEGAQITKWRKCLMNQNLLLRL